VRRREASRARVVERVDGVIVLVKGMVPIRGYRYETEQGKDTKDGVAKTSAPQPEPIFLDEATHGMLWSTVASVQSGLLTILLAFLNPSKA
jgi:hypothetical protein